MCNCAGAPISSPTWSRPCRPTHERGLFEEVTAARREHRGERCRRTGGGGRALAGLLGRLMAVARLSATWRQNFLDLQGQLAEIEDQIQMARRYYNGAVRNLNISIESFPDVLVARLLGFKEEPFFELEDRGEAAAPQVAFPGAKP